jgi:3-oxoacyl-[acyl-carrier-protein] synthase III
MIDWLVPHQANKRIIAYTAEPTGLPMDRVMMVIQKYSNTTRRRSRLACGTTRAAGRPATA